MTTPDHLTETRGTARADRDQPEGPDHLTGYKTNLKGDAFLQKALNETVVKDLWESLDSRSPIDLPEPGQPIVADRVERDIRAQNYADQIENTFTRGKGELPLSWILEQDPDDLALLDVQAAPIMRTTQLHADWHRQKQKEFEDTLHKKTEAKIRSHDLARRYLNLVPGGEGLTVFFQDKEYDEVRAEIEREALEEPDTFWRDLVDFVYRGTGLKTAVDIGKAIPGTEDISLVGALPAVGRPLHEFLSQAHEEEYQRQKAELDTLVPEELGREAMETEYASLWQEMVEDGRAQEWIEMGMGDEATGFGLFASALEENIPDPEAQVSLLGEEIQAGMARLLQENDYGPVAEVMDALSLWGKGVMILPTGLSLLLTDEDLRSDVLQGEFSKMWDGIVDSDFSPAEALGIGGTAVGLGLDIGAGIAFDPLTWVFGPTAGVAGQRARTAAEVAVEMGSIGMKRSIDDMVRLAIDGDMAGLSVIGKFVDDVGELDNLVRFGNDVHEVRSLGALGEVAAAPDGFVYHVTDAFALDEIAQITAGKLKLNKGGLASRKNLDQMTVVHGEKGTGNPKFVLAIDKADLPPEVIQQLGRSGQIDDLSRFNRALPDGLPARAAYRAGDDAAEVLARVEDAHGTFSKIIERAMLNGAKSPNANRTALGVAWNSRVQASVRSGKLEDVQRYAGQHHTVTRFDYDGPGAFGRMLDTADSLWGANRTKATEWSTRLMNARRNLANRRAARVEDPAFVEHRALTEAIEEVRDMTGGGWDSWLSRTADEAVDLTQAKANFAQMQKAITQMEKRHTQLGAELAAKYPAVDDMSEIGQEMLAMWDDYNRTVLAQMPGWKKYVGEDGLVPWEVLRGSAGKMEDQVQDVVRQFFPDEVLTDLGPAGEDMIQKLSGTLNREMAVNVPLSPLDMVIASSAAGAKYTKLLQNQVLATMREQAFNFHRLWIIDKVMRPATAMTVSFDELSRVFHRYGMKAATRYMEDKAIGVGARASRMLRVHGSNLPKRWRDRLQRLSEYPTTFKQAERQTFENAGQKWTTVNPGDPDYVDAARHWSGILIQDKGFQAVLKGRDEFQKFWMGDAGRSARLRTVKDADGHRLMTFEEAWEGWQTTLNTLFNTSRKAGRYDDVRRAFVEAAERSSPGVSPELPHWVAKEGLLGPVRGARRATPDGMSGGIMSVQEWFFDKFFMDPTNYRRGFIHDLAYKTEMERLTKLHASQGIRTFTDQEAARLLGLGDGANARLALGDLLDDMLRKHPEGGVSHARLEKLAEQHAIDEIDNMLYSWDTGSRLGKQMKAVFPFGGPWADMWGFWGREMMTRPALRGWINDANFANMGQHAQQATSVLPFNPRVPAMMSRLAETDFDIDRGWWPENDSEGNPIDRGEGLLPGSTSFDLGPLFFLPTGGDNPFQSIIPGLGAVPTETLDLIITQLADPIENAAEYENLLGEVAKFLPGMGYTRGSVVADMVGGGTIGTGVGALTDILTITTGAGFYELPQYMGDISQDINRTRELSAILADPDELAELLAMKDEELIIQALAGLGDEASRNAALAHLGERAARFIVPARSDFDTALDEIYDVWITAGNRFPDLASTSPVDRIDQATPEERRQLGDDVRRNFFQLPQWKRDLYIAEYPQLAVNLVSSWQWTRRAQNELGDDALTTYRVEATDTGFARHQQYIHDGYIRPTEPLERAYHILGLMNDSKQRAAKRIYEFQVASINENTWETFVSPADKAKLEIWMNTELPNGKTYGEQMGVNTPREMWEQWGSIEGEVEEVVAEMLGLPWESLEVQKKIKEGVGIVHQTKPWSASWPGLDNMPSTRTDVPLREFPEEVQDLASGLGIDLTPGMTLGQLFNGIEEIITENETPLWDIVRGPYMDYQGRRSKPAEAAMSGLRERIHDEDLDPEWRRDLRDFLTFTDNVQNRMFEMGDVMGTQQGAVDTIMRGEIMEVRQRFGELMATGDDANVAWNTIWDDGFARTFGPLEWEPPQPQPLYAEDGDLNSEAYAPIIRRVIDGDTIEVQPSDQDFFGLMDNAGPRSVRSVRILGLRARELSSDPEGGAADKIALLDALQDAVDAGENIFLVRDPLRRTDSFGRELAWLYLGDEPYWDEDSFLPGD